MFFFIFYQMCLCLVTVSLGLSIQKHETNENNMDETIMGESTQEIDSTQLNEGIYANYGTGYLYNETVEKELIKRDEDKVAHMLKKIQQTDDANDDDSFDWRDHNQIRPIGDQGQCGSCWAFATIGMVECSYYMKYKKLIPLSQSQLVECDKYDCGCNGGTFYSVQKYLEENGLESEENYPYENGSGDVKECEYNKDKVEVKVVNITYFDGADRMKKMLKYKGPIGVALNARLLGYYDQTYHIIMKNDKVCNPEALNHAVLIVGYGVENAIPFWIVRNSWGSEFGKDGYFRIERGSNTCGIEKVAAIVEVE